MQRSQRIGSLTASHPALGAERDRHEREKRQGNERRPDAGLGRNRLQVAAAPAREKRAEAASDTRIDDGAGKNADHRAGHEASDPHAEEGRDEVDDAEREERDEAQEEKIPECVALEPGFEAPDEGAGALPERLAERGSRKQEDGGRAGARAN